jgi:hypothetical protein
MKSSSPLDMRHWPCLGHNTTSLQWLDRKPFIHPMDAQPTMQSSKDFCWMSLDEMMKFRMRLIKEKEAEHWPQLLRLCQVETSTKI